MTWFGTWSQTQSSRQRQHDRQLSLVSRNSKVNQALAGRERGSRGQAAAGSCYLNGGDKHRCVVNALLCSPAIKSLKDSTAARGLTGRATDRRCVPCCCTGSTCAAKKQTSRSPSVASCQALQPGGVTKGLRCESLPLIFLQQCHCPFVFRHG
jgi:hypothetical protein